MNARFVFLEKPDRLPMMASQFRVPYSRVLSHLERELRTIHATSITVFAGFRQVRQDGWPYSSARPEHPAVKLQFGSGPDTLLFAASRYRSFEDNLRAIALTLEALRAVERYSVVKGEQYLGFKQIASPQTALRQDVSRYAAAARLALLADCQPLELLSAADRGDRDKVKAAYRLAVAKVHPDRGGAQEAFVKVKEAFDLLMTGNPA